MADGRNSETPAHIRCRMTHRRTRADSASHVHQRLMEELRRFGDELVDERVPQQLLDVIRSWQDRFDR
jgi:hypothetical protein